MDRPPSAYAKLWRGVFGVGLNMMNLAIVARLVTTRIVPALGCAFLPWALRLLDPVSPQPAAEVKTASIPMGTLLVAAIAGALAGAAATYFGRRGKPSRHSHVVDERLRLAVDSATIAVFFADYDGRITFANSTAQRLFGYTAEELEGQSVELLVPHRFRQQHVQDREAYAKAPASRPMGAGRDLFAVRKDGAEIPVEISLSPVANNNQSFVMVTVTDITPRKEAERALRDSEERLELAIQGTSDGLWDWDITNDTIRFAPRFLKLLALRPDDAPESFDAFMGLVHPDDRRELEEQIRRHIEDDIPFDTECRLQTQDDDYHWFRIRGATKRDPEGHAVRMAGSIQDVTEQKWADRNLQDYAKRLQRLNEALAARNRELDEFTYVASHDLQEPLRKLITFSDLLREDMPGELPEDAAADLDTITSAAKRMQRLVQDLLTLSRSGQREMEKREVSLDECLDEALDLLDLRIEETGAEIRRTKLGTAWGDRVLLTQLLQNLMANAIKFRGDQPPIVEITKEMVNQRTVYGVRDNGIGIDIAHHEQVFAPFKRLHPVHVYDGSGIGLAVCRKIVIRHGGRIWVESEIGKGAHFRFSLHEAV